MTEKIQKNILNVLLNKPIIEPINPYKLNTFYPDVSRDIVKKAIKNI